MDTNSFIGIAALLFSLSNPIGVIPIVLSLTRDLTTGQKTMVIAAAASAVAGLLILSVLTGRQLLGFFNVGLDDFRIAGGLLALFVAFEMFQAKYGGFMQTREETSRTETDIHGIAITPLAFPLLVGPAEMSIMITLSSDAPTWMHKGGLIAPPS
ncbi:MAG: MarC family protein [Asticcacaulis sp.]|nr:MarC family protein [Asticcacaulis sp.]